MSMKTQRLVLLALGLGAGMLVPQSVRRSPPASTNRSARVTTTHSTERKSSSSQSPKPWTWRKVGSQR